MWWQTGLLATGLFLAGAGTAAARTWEEELDGLVAARRDEEVRAIQEVLRIPSYNHGSPTTPAPGVVRVLDALLARAEGMGMRTRRHPEARYGIVEIGPEDAREMVMVLGHLDTVPEGNPALWTLAGPFEGKVVDGRIVGRGATDDKGPCVASLYAMKALQEAKLPLKRRIRLFLGTSEDGAGLDGLSWSCVAAYAELCRRGEEEWPTLGFSPDTGSFTVTYIEKTGVNVLGDLPLRSPASARLVALRGGSAPNAVSDLCTFALEATDEAGAEALLAALEAAAAGQPWQDAAKVRREGTTVRGEVIGVAAHSGQAWKGRSANVRALFLLAQAAPGEDWGKAAAKLVELLGVDRADGEALGIRQGDPEKDDNVTVNLGLLELKVREGEPRLTFHVNIRYPGTGADLKVPTLRHFTGGQIREKVATAFRAAGFQVGEGKEIALTGGGEPYTVPWDSEIVVRLRKAYRDAAGEDREPEIVFGGTYASAWRNEPVDDRGTLFGYRMAAWGMEGGAGEHEPDESLTLEGMERGTRILARALAGLGGVTD